MKTIIISGGADGIGKAVAQSLASDHTVVILDIDSEKTKRVSEELGCEYAICDITDYKKTEHAIGLIVEAFGGVDVLINCAGLWIQGLLDENDADKIRSVIDVNAVGTIFLTKAVIPHMKEKKSGLIINLISQDGIYGKTERSVYTASKFAVTGFTKSIEPELAPFGIRVTGLYPGPVNTKLFEKAGNERDLSNALDTREIVNIANFLIHASEDTVFPEIGVKHIRY